MWLQGGMHQFRVELCGNGSSSQKSLCYNGRMGNWECVNAMAMAGCWWLPRDWGPRADLMVSVYNVVEVWRTEIARVGTTYLPTYLG